MVWLIVAEMALALIAVFVFMPRPKSQKPASLQDFNVPTAEDGREVVDVCGTVWIDDPNVIWYGDLYTVPIRADGGK